MEGGKRLGSTTGPKETSDSLSDNWTVLEQGLARVCDVFRGDEQRPCLRPTYPVLLA